MSGFANGLDAVSPNCEIDGFSDEGGYVELTVGDDEHSEEGAAARGVTVPIRPSQKEINKRMLTHIPFQIMVPSLCQGQGS